MVINACWCCCNVPLIGSCTSEWNFLRYCQSTASTVSFFFSISILSPPCSLCHTHFPVGSITYPSCHDSGAVRAARTDDEQPQEKNKRASHLFEMTSFTLIHLTDSRPAEPLQELDSLALLYMDTHTHTHNLFLDTWPNIGPY